MEAASSAPVCSVDTLLYPNISWKLFLQYGSRSYFFREITLLWKKKEKPKTLQGFQSPFSWLWWALDQCYLYKTFRIKFKNCWTRNFTCTSSFTVPQTQMSSFLFTVIFPHLPAQVIVLQYESKLLVMVIRQSIKHRCLISVRDSGVLIYHHASPVCWHPCLHKDFLVCDRSILPSSYPMVHLP